MTALPASPWTLDSIPGWFPETDMRLFEWLLDRQSRVPIRGDLLELGAYLGRSAVVIGRHRHPDERFTVCDLFRPLSAGAAVHGHPPLSRAAFETNYLAFHPDLPHIVQGASASIRDHVKPESCRFVHIDASKKYEDVSADLEAAKEIVVPEGIVVVEGYRAENTPGVALAVWDTVAAGGLRPICLTPTRFYGTWGDPTPIREQLAEWLAERPDEWSWGEHMVAGRMVLHARLIADGGHTRPLPSHATPVAPRWTAKKAPKQRPVMRRLARLALARVRRSMRSRRPRRGGWSGGHGEA